MKALRKTKGKTLFDPKPKCYETVAREANELFIHQRLVNQHPMKIVNGHIGSIWSLSKAPTHGVYNEEVWDSAGSATVALSLHWSFDTAVDAATRLEKDGILCVVVCFENLAS